MDSDRRRSARRLQISLGARIRDARISAGISQYCLAASLGLNSGHGQFVSNLERGLTPLPLQHVDALAKILKIDAAKLLLDVLTIRRTKYRSEDSL